MKQRIFQRLLMTAAVAGLLTVGAHAARRSVPVQVDADTLPVRGYVDSGVTYVPLRALLNGLDAGWRVWWVLVCRVWPWLWGLWWPPRGQR